MTRLSIVTLLVVLGACVALAQQKPERSAEAAAVTAGRRAFAEYACFYCHGTVGQGSLPAVGPRIARAPRSLASFTAYVRRPSGRMSAYSEGMISDAALADIYAYLRSQPEPTTARPALIELMRTR